MAIIEILMPKCIFSEVIPADAILTLNLPIPIKRSSPLRKDSMPW